MIIYFRYEYTITIIHFKKFVLLSRCILRYSGSNDMMSGAYKCGGSGALGAGEEAWIEQEVSVMC